MSEKELPALPNLEQYKKQAKDLQSDFSLGNADALDRVKRYHPRFHKLPTPNLSAPFSRTDAQLVLAREHGFESWPKFAKHIETIDLIRSVASLGDPVGAFNEVACVPRHSGHSSGALEHANMILSRYSDVASSNIFTAAILADEPAVRRFLSRDPEAATVEGGPHGWDALTYLCFSRYLRLDPTRSEAFVMTARTLLDAGASAKTGWYEMIDHPTPRPILESAIYGAAAVARHPGLTRLLLERGADPNDEETPYHLPEGYDNTVMKIVLESGKLNRTSLTTMLVRKADWHDQDGMRMLLEHGADTDTMPRWGNNALQQALRRDNRLQIVELLLEYGANPALKNNLDGRSAIAMAAHRGRGDVLTLFEQRGFFLDLHGVDRMIAACAMSDRQAEREAVASIVAKEPHLSQQILAHGGTLLAEFASNGNVAGIQCLLDLGVNAAARYGHGDLYFDIAKESTALHVAAWRAWPSVVKQLLARGAPVNALDAKGRTALALAVKACVDSYWTDRRSPDSVDALLRAGASIAGIELPTGYEEIDKLLRQFGAS